MYLSIELQSFGVYILSTIFRDSESSTFAGLKYFLLGGLSSCIILLGCGIIYSYIGLTNLESIFSLISVSDSQSIVQGCSLGIFIIIVGFLFKISAAPFHSWSPGVYDAIPTVTTTFVAIIPKIGILILFLEIMIYYIDLPKDHTMLYFAYFLFYLLKESLWYPEILNEVFPYNFRANFDILDILTKLLIWKKLCNYQNYC